SSLNASNVEKIEIITVPPANYDSDGDAGIINIELRRGGAGVGTHAQFTTGLSFGTDLQGNFNLGINYQGKKLSWFSDYSFNAILRDEIWESYRESSNSWESLSTLNNTDRNVDRIVHTYQFGVDYPINSSLRL